VIRLVRSGELEKPEVCELCGVNITTLNQQRSAWMRKSRIVAHHWNGYSSPLDVWWICTMCHWGLPHDGTLDKQTAIKRVNGKSRW
jgi:hypothetical protein